MDLRPLSAVFVFACFAWAISCSESNNSSPGAGPDGGGGASGGTAGTGGGGTGGGTPACGSPACAVDDATEPAAGGNYRSWAYTTGVSVGAVDLSANGRRILVGDQAGKVHLFKHDGGGTPLWTFTAQDPQAQFNSVAISRDGRSAAATDGLTSVYAFTCDQGTPAWTFDSHDDNDHFVAVDVSSDGCRIAAVSHEKVYLFERDNATPVAVYTPDVSQGGWLTTVAISGNGSRIAAGTWISDESGARLFVYDDTHEVGSFPTSYAYQSSNAVPMPIAISNDGSVIAAGGADKKLHFFSGSMTPAWSYDAGSAEGSVWSVALSDDGKQLFASSGEDNAVMFQDTATGSPSWSYDGNYASPHATGVGLVDPYKGGSSADGDFGIGAYPGTVYLSADGKYAVAGAWNSGNLFGLYTAKDRPFRVYRTSNGDTDSINVAAISADGSWVVAGTTFGEVLAWEVAPAVMIEIGTPVTVNVPANPDVTATLGLGDVDFQRTLVKPGRGAKMKETWSLWAIIAGVPVPPEASWLVSSGDFEKTFIRDLADGNVDETTSETMQTPQVWQSALSGVTGFVLRVALEDDGTSKLTSDEAAGFVDIQVGSGP